MLPLDLITVRPDEQFDEAAVAKFVRQHLPGATGPMSVTQFSGGHANLTYLLSFGRESPTEYVLRRPPLGPVAPGAHDMSREHQVLSRLWKEFDLAPRSFALCEDKSLIGAPFFLMERKAGVVVRKKIPAIFGGGDDPATNRKLSEMVIDTLVQFHGVKPDQADLGDLGRPVGFLERQIHGWSQRWDASKLDDIPLVDELRQWLRDKLPTSDRTTLVHNDWRLDNMAVAADDPSRCVAVYDWDMCTQGDPLADLGTLLSVWYDEDEAPASLNPMPTMAEGFITRRQAAERYSSLMNIDTGEVDYYIVFGSFKMAVVLQQIFIRWHRGQTQDERFAAMGEGAMSLFSLAADRRP